MSVDNIKTWLIKNKQTTIGIHRKQPRMPVMHFS